MFRWRKWDGGPHWVHDCVYLGSDRWGDWFGQLPGWDSTRPGRDYLVPTASERHAGAAERRLRAAR